MVCCRNGLVRLRLLNVWAARGLVCPVAYCSPPRVTRFKGHQPRPWALSCKPSSRVVPLQKSKSSAGATKAVGRVLQAVSTKAVGRFIRKGLLPCWHRQW